MKTLSKANARKWLDDHGHAAVDLQRKGRSILNVPPIYMIKAGIDSTWTLTALGAGSFTLDVSEPQP